MATYKWALNERGFKEIPFEEYTEEQKRKFVYVKKYLSPSVEYSRCGWDHVVYVIMSRSIFLRLLSIADVVGTMLGMRFWKISMVERNTLFCIQTMRIAMADI